MTLIISPAARRRAARFAHAVLRFVVGAAAILALGALGVRIR